MSARISYFRNNFTVELKELIFARFSAFREWYLETDKSSTTEFNEPFGNEILKNYLRSETDLKIDFNTIDKKLVDELTSEFIANYYGSAYFADNELILLDPCVSKWRYDTSSEMVLKTCDQDFIKVWNYIINGRSLKDGKEIDSYSNEYKIGYLTFDERKFLQKKIKTIFGDIERLKENESINAGL